MILLLGLIQTLDACFPRDKAQIFQGWLHSCGFHPTGPKSPQVSPPTVRSVLLLITGSIKKPGCIQSSAVLRPFETHAGPLPWEACSARGREKVHRYPPLAPRLLKPREMWTQLAPSHMQQGDGRASTSPAAPSDAKTYPPLSCRLWRSRIGL